MASWLQAQLKAAENLLEAVDRTVSATSGSQPQAMGSRDSGGGGEHKTAMQRDKCFTQFLTVLTATSMLLHDCRVQ
jgi:hypothetical protein